MKTISGELRRERVRKTHRHRRSEPVPAPGTGVAPTDKCADRVHRKPWAAIEHLVLQDRRKNAGSNAISSSEPAPQTIPFRIETVPPPERLHAIPGASAFGITMNVAGRARCRPPSPLGLGPSALSLDASRIGRSTPAIFCFAPDIRNDIENSGSRER